VRRVAAKSTATRLHARGRENRRGEIRLANCNRNTELPALSRCTLRSIVALGTKVRDHGVPRTLILGQRRRNAQRLYSQVSNQKNSESDRGE
jgi:hypothetical protein